ncbi:MAG: addiction module antidote protein, HigA family [Planctomycetota bacterium]|nr:MAG: addiction module antidote protein, HigA family [Planctomycetota bacterium]
MTQTNTNQFVPDYAVAPGDILEETLESLRLSKSEFAKRAGLSSKTVSLIVSGQAPVTSDNAVVFERVLGISAQVWTNIESEYRLFWARKKAAAALEDAVAWSKEFPLAAMVKRGVLDIGLNAISKAGALLNFFRVKDPAAWDTRYGNMAAAFHKSAAFKSDYKSVVTWLRLAELRAESIQTDPFDIKEFKNALKQIRLLTDKEPSVFEHQMKDLCRQSGVALVFVSEFPKTHLSGATRWLSSEKAMIALSLRYKSNDHFWFTFFHEAGHILKHGKRDVYIDESVRGHTDEEQEASQFASSFLIPDAQYNKFIQSSGRFSSHTIKQFAEQVGIAPGIVVGRLQHDKHLDYRWLNELKVRFVLLENNASKPEEN